MDKKNRLHKEIMVSQAIGKSFNNKVILEGISFSIYKKEIVSLLGPSGIGKSTLLNILSGIEKPTVGKVEMFIEKVGYVFQDDRLLPWLTLFENIRLVNISGNINMVQEILKTVGLEAYANYYPYQLSGGMRQRGSIARAMYYAGELLFLDEAFKSLDEYKRIELLNLLLTLKESIGLSSLFVTHDIEEAIYVSDRILVLNGEPAKIIKEINIKEKRIEGKLSLKDETEIRRKILHLLYEKTINKEE
ncbi:ABC transporter ATP-binding protein [Fusobacterium simiae]|uniref:ABC transporter ATP-binding protein n=1 Tax=Fusobacterium TaxID=848 RepID=UPI00189B886B|nr:ABC transporter ATP-binding protein [Fusobacterium simiae]MDC7955452.1 ABC transporter ATP-binding protein [Fusobacterium simiae]